jgi:two-component system, LytTR family, response regulator
MRVHKFHFITKTCDAMTTAATLRHHPQPTEAPIISVRIPRKVGTRKKPMSSKVALPSMEGLVFEKIKHIMYLEAEGNYTKIYFDDKRTLLVCKTLRELESMLPDKQFVRIHRSHTVHLKFVHKYIRGKSGYVVLYNKKALNISLGQKDAFIDALNVYFSM